jgi:leucyl-tRNA synthetase
MPVDLYVGGAEHAVLHLLYARFWHKVLYDLGPRAHGRAVPEAAQPGHGARLQLPLLRRRPERRARDPALYPASEVVLDGETPRHAKTGAELKERWLLASEVRWKDEQPYHPTADLPLEAVTEKMSKSRGNVVNPDEVVARFGTDSMRLYEMFMGPIEKGAPWSDEAIPGLYRFLQRAHRLVDGRGRRADRRGSRQR